MQPPAFSLASHRIEESGFVRSLPLWYSGQDMVEGCLNEGTVGIQPACVPLVPPLRCQKPAWADCRCPPFS